MADKLTLKQARNLCGLSRKAVAEQIGVHPCSIINWETSRSYPDAKQFMLLCKMYAVEPDSILLP